MEAKPLLLTIITVVVVMAAILGACAYLIYIERKVAAFIQDRIGPNRVGFKGLLQPIADGLKFLLKEDIIPEHVDKLLYLAAPAISATMALLAFAVVPFGPTQAPPRPPTRPAATAGDPEKAEYQQARTEYEQKLQQYESAYQFVVAPRVDIGIVFIFAVTSLTVYAIILGGWSSNNKYSFIGGLRSSAQLVSYEIPMGMSLLGVILLTGSLNLEQIINQQIWGGWNIWYQPLAFLIFVTAAFAECNRLPFDLPEAEQELVGGYHTEYSALKFAMFFLGEYAHVITTSFLMAILFFGGWYFPWIAEPEFGVILKLVVLFLKMAAFILFYMLIRWTIPRFRFDQLMGLAWKVLIPLALVNLVCVIVIKHLMTTYGLDRRWLWLLGPVTLVLFLLAGIPALVWSGKSRRTRLPVSRSERPLATAR